jgi:hypothetical protein
MKTYRNGSFLLIIVIGIGIAGMLLLLVIPMVQVIQEYQNKHTCMRNLKTLFTALEIYRGDYDGGVPFSGDSTNLLWDGVRNEKVFIGVLYPKYAKMLTVFYCPTQKLYTGGNPDYGWKNFGKPGVYCYGGYLVRGSCQFDSGLQPDTFFDPDAYPEKPAWISDYNLPDTKCTAHKGKGVYVLSAAGRVAWCAGTYAARSEKDHRGGLFWRILDVQVPRKRLQKKEPAASNVTPETVPTVTGQNI